MKKVLITGIDSFTGKHLSLYLENLGYNVYGTSRSKSSAKTYKCDICKKEDILKIISDVKPDYFIHLSGISFAAHGNDEDFYKVNTIGTINILDAFVELEQKPSKVILASSATVYGNQGISVLDELLCPKPANHYGASKYSMECISRAYFDKLPIIITRPFNYVGVGQAEHFLIPKIVNHYKENKKIIELGNTNVSREFNDIDYVCEIYLKLLVCKSKGEVVNISSNNGIKLLAVIDIMNKLAGYNIEIKVNPKFVRKDDIKSLTGSTEKLFSLIGSVNSSKIEDILKKMYD